MYKISRQRALPIQSSLKPSISRLDRGEEDEGARTLMMAREREVHLGSTFRHGSSESS